MNEMQRANRILCHKSWRAAAAQIAAHEENRKFCRHNIDHLLHVAMLACLENLERELEISKELIYSAALLHDIGRGRQYMEGIPHEEAGAVMAASILDDCGFDETEKEKILDAVRSHRNRAVSCEDTLRGLIYRADKLSRNCFACAAESECSWAQEKKNLYLVR